MMATGGDGAAATAVRAPSTPRAPHVAVLVPSWNGRAHLEVCLAALAAQHDPGCPWSTWVLDNGSQDGTTAWLARTFPHVRVVASTTNLGFAAGMNRLVEAAADAELVAFLNNDTRPVAGWLGELVGALRGADAEVSAVSGAIVDWDGERLDFGRGVMTFDGHAFQLDYGRPLPSARRPQAGDELFFACGGNMLVRRDAFRRAGSFDATFFAYYEDVDLGWRLRARGERILAAPGAVVHHRSGATSELLGLYRRGFLFERNAFATVHKNLDAELWPLLMPAVLTTLVARTQHLLAHTNAGGELLLRDPYARASAGSDVASTEPSPSSVAGAAREPQRFGNLRRGDWAGAWRSVRRRLARPTPSPREAVVVDDARTIAQLQAVSSLLATLDGAADRRRQTQAARRVSDRALFAQFPPYLVPTYPGDEALFASPGFRALLPAGLQLVEARLADVMRWP